MAECVASPVSGEGAPAEISGLCAGMQFDWDDSAGDSKRREAGLKLEALRKAEEKRLRLENKGKTYKQGPQGGRKKKEADAAARGPKPGASSTADRAGNGVAGSSLSGNGAA